MISLKLVLTVVLRTAKDTNVNRTAYQNAALTTVSLLSRLDHSKYKSKLNGESEQQE